MKNRRNAYRVLDRIPEGKGTDAVSRVGSKY
jgi:hypothetical protein